MMFYTIVSDETEMLAGKKPTVMSKVEDIFLAKYRLYREIGDDRQALKYLHYYTDVVELRNRLEFGLTSE
jgi:hypothetical protein